MLTLRTLYLLIIVALTAGSCKIPLHTLSDEEIKEHYRDRKNKPSFKYLKYKDYHIHHAIVGDSTKPLLLYIHGAPGAWYSSMRIFDDTIMQKNFRMISVDRVGFGKSNYGMSVTSINQHVRYLEKLVDEYNITGSRIHIIGTSYGGPIAAAFAMQNPELMEELYLISPVLDPSTEKIFWFSWLARLSFVYMWLPPSLQVATDEKFAHRKELRKMKPHWKNITCKTYVLMGEKDWIADTANLSFAKRVLVNAPDPEFFLLPNVGHGILWRRGDLVKDLLLNRPVNEPRFDFVNN